jgi:glyoxylase-like metal-dependent hydrolase (beta-lactamase superfamily II)
MRIQHFFHPQTATLTYVVHDEIGKVGVVIDPVMDFDTETSRVWYGSCEQVAAYIKDQDLQIPYVMDTHAHADHLSGVQFFKQRYGAATVIGRYITTVQACFQNIYRLGPDFPVDGRQFDRLFDEGERCKVGSMLITAMHTPGHTPVCMSYRIGDALFVGDVLFMPDYGTARCDFPGGSAATLYESIQKIYRLPGETRIFTGHDYQPGGRPLRYASTVEEERAENVQLNERTTKAAFITLRAARDATLAMPALLHASIPVNIRAGHVPEIQANGQPYCGNSAKRL